MRNGLADVFCRVHLINGAAVRMFLGSSFGNNISGVIGGWVRLGFVCDAQSSIQNNQNR